MDVWVRPKDKRSGSGQGRQLCSRLLELVDLQLPGITLRGVGIEDIHPLPAPPSCLMVADGKQKIVSLDEALPPLRRHQADL